MDAVTKSFSADIDALEESGGREDSSGGEGSSLSRGGGGCGGVSGEIELGGV